ncbi:MAG: alpha-L-fucosidase [Muribaculaceae bacterium]|jgi:alpha-L-fucosidase|nr:alpha-L-fucosidase [Muribaculaceae bacterium]
MGTFCNRDWATGHEDPLIFNPKHLDCNQWVSVAKNAGMKYLVLTVKHTGGWCLWDSKYTTHDITAFKNYKNGKGDIVREFVNACRKQKMKVGFYYCLPGNFSRLWSASIEDEKRGYKITPNQENLYGLPIEAKGDYEGFIEKQVTELLTKYGKIDYMFFDQWNNSFTGKYWRQLKALVNRLQPNCIIVANNSNNYEDTDIFGYEFPYLSSISKEALPTGNNINASEVCDCIVKGGIWFWKSDRPCPTISAKEIIYKLNYCNSHNANYLLNVQPSPNGIIEGELLNVLNDVAKSNRHIH